MPSATSTSSPTESPLKPPKKKVLFFTNSEHGQASVFLATTYALLLQDPTVEVHFASFKPIEPSVQKIFAQAQKDAAQPDSLRPVVWHEIHATDYMTALLRPEHKLLLHVWLGPGFFTTPLALWSIMRIVQPWSGEEFVQIFEETLRIVQEVKPNVIAIDPILSPAFTACQDRGMRFCILAPNTIKDFAVTLQPGAQMFWKYPAVGSSYPYPVPWYLIPLNIYYIFIAIIFAIFDFRGHAIRRYVLKHTGASVRNMFTLNQYPPLGFKELVPTYPELDYPMYVPQHIVPCGPILRPAPPVAQLDPELAAWLDKGPTILINRGSHAVMNEPYAVQMAGSLRMLFDYAERNGEKQKLQVLWKLGKWGEFEVDVPGCKVYNMLEKEMQEGRVRIVEWIAAEPHSVLLSGKVVCSVNHGGANSFFEALSAAVPQVVLPGWADCFDYAHRVELLGIGRWGSRRAKPRWEARELGPILIDVILSENAEGFRNRAKEVARRTLKQGQGRDNAAKYLLNLYN